MEKKDIFLLLDDLDAKEEKPLKEPWSEWEKLLAREGFVYDSEKDGYLNYDLKMGWTKKTISNEFEDMADFKDWIDTFRADPDRQANIKEICTQFQAGKGVRTTTTQ